MKRNNTKVSCVMHKFVEVLEKYDQMLLEKGNKDILDSWKEQATKLKCKPSEFYKTFMLYLTDRDKGNTNEISLSINSIVYKRFLITCVNILLLHVALCQSRT